MDQSKLTRMSRYSNKENIIFYVSDMEELPATGHFRKMDAGREIAMHISRGLNNTKLRKYTQYDGGILEANSVGIVFPTHMWGISLAVYSFVKHLRVSTGTYVYAVVVGESMSASVDATLTRRLGSMERFNRIFMEQGFGNEENIYMRSIDFKRDFDTTEESLRGEKDNIVKLNAILEGLLFYSVENMKKGEFCDSKTPYNMPKASGLEEYYLAIDTNSKRDVIRGDRHKLSNIFLDDSILSGVKLCQVM